MPDSYLPLKEPYWAKLNPNMVRNLPKPSNIAVSSWAKDPKIYPDAPNPKSRIMREMFSKVVGENGYPYSSVAGFFINHGKVIPPLKKQLK